MQPIPVFDLQAIDEQVDDLHLETHASALGQPCFAIGRFHQSFQTFAKAVIIEVVQRRRCTRALHQIQNPAHVASTRSEEHTSELQSLMRISYAVFCLKKKNSPQFIHKMENVLHNTTPTTCTIKNIHN